jgi:hypothetical protein
MTVLPHYKVHAALKLPFSRPRPALRAREPIVERVAVIPAQERAKLTYLLFNGVESEAHSIGVIERYRRPHIGRAGGESRDIATTSPKLTMRDACTRKRERECG